MDIDESIEKQINEICHQHLKSYPQILRSKKNSNLWNYILSRTKPLQEKELEIDYHYRVSTYVNWTLKHRIQFGSCKRCGKEFFKYDLQLDGEYPKWCSNACMNSSEEHKKSVADSLEKHYGVRVPSKHPQILQKMKNTCLERYGVDNFWKTEELKNIISSPEVKAKRLESLKKYNLEHYGVEWFVQSEDFNKKVCATGGTSKEEKEVVGWLKKFIDEKDMVVGSYQIIYPLQLDIYLPQQKIGIEFNGTFYHCIERGIDLNYHLNKTKKCEEQGIKLIHIWEDDWYCRKDNVKTFIRNYIENSSLLFEKYLKIREDGLIEIDRAKFNKCCIDKNIYEIIEETNPKLCLRSKNKKDFLQVPDCGKIILKKKV